MEPRKIGEVEVDGTMCGVYVAPDPGGSWIAIQQGSVILVRAAGSTEIEMSIARSFVNPRPF